MLVNTIRISNTRQCARLKFDRIGIGAQPRGGDARWADNAFHVDMEYKYADADGPQVYGRASRYERDGGG